MMILVPYANFRYFLIFCFYNFCSFIK
uniref:Uncharacterized protein n=1 Tax=Anguilla anguilla TaxID=7936 RepID=A0A0E9SPK0_ANGAN